MRRLSSNVRLVLLVLVASVAQRAAARTGEVYLRASTNALVARITDADLVDCELLRPSPETLVLVVHGMTLSLPTPRDRFELARTVRLVGPELLGRDESRLVIELFSSAVTATLDEVASGVVLDLRLPVEPTAVEPAPPVVPAAEAGEPRPRTITTPWRQARQSARADRSEAEAEALAAPTPGEVRYAEEEERRRRREERERRVEARAALGQAAPVEIPPSGPATDQSRPAAPAAPAAEPPRYGAPTTPSPERLPPAPSGVQPSPATPVAAGMVRIPGGPFRMGSTVGEGFEDEEPQHVVDVGPFWIDTHEVTVGEYRRSAFRLPEQPAWNVEDDRPAVNVAWYEAEQYCDWLGKRLPTEAEWEKAARGVDGRRYPWGEGWDVSFANSGVEGDGFDATAPVGSFPEGVSPDGALDMAGNAWEWTGDWYSAATYKSTRRDYTSPRGPSRGAHKVVRGGSFRGEHSVNVRSALRMGLAPASRRDDVGFRCASDPR